MQDGTREGAIDGLATMADGRDATQDLPFPGILTWDGLDDSQ